MIQRIDAAILANGDYPTAKIPLEVLASAPYIACCDGAGNEYLKRGHIPNIIIGDGDSFSEENKKLYRHLLHRITEQEDNDLTKTINYLAQIGMKQLAIVGATGKREDHTLGNISLLMEYMQKGLTVRMYTDFGVFIPCKHDIRLSSYPGQQVSIFNFGAKKMSAHGLVYPIRDFTTLWQGTLNECNASEFQIKAEGNYLVFLNY